MSVVTFIQRQITQIRQGGVVVILEKMKRSLQLIIELPMYILAIPTVVLIRLIRPWLLLRIGGLHSSRLGHFAANTELYLCERDAFINTPKQQYFDLFYFAYKPICNLQLAKMWKRVLHVWPVWLLSPIVNVNRLIPYGAVHEIGNNTQWDRDIHNLLDQFSPHLQFNDTEEKFGLCGLLALGIPKGAPFVCLNVRDSTYLNKFQPGEWDYHNYRDSDVQNYVLAAETLAGLGYFVIRMGVVVHEPIKSINPKVIDYAANGMRNDFMDIYLGAKCEFCISVGSGFDAVPFIFHRPTVYVNMVPLGYLGTYIKKSIGITKHYYKVQENRELTMNEIFAQGLGFSSYGFYYESKGIQFIENTPEEIRDVVVEMAERLNGTWQPHEDDEALQKRFWEIFPTDALDTIGVRLHGQIRTRFGTHFLRNNREWLGLNRKQSSFNLFISKTKSDQ